MKLDGNRAVLNITGSLRDNAQRAERRQVATDVNFHDGVSFVDNDANRNNNYSAPSLHIFVALFQLIPRCVWIKHIWQT